MAGGGRSGQGIPGVQESIAERFIPMFVERTRALKVAPGFEAGGKSVP